MCSFQFVCCLIYYHSKCIGLEQLKSRHDGEVYSNCKDGVSFICPLCKKKCHMENFTKNDGNGMNINCQPFMSTLQNRPLKMLMNIPR